MGQVCNKHYDAGDSGASASVRIQRAEGRSARRESVTVGDLPCEAATRSNGLEANARGDPLCGTATRSRGLDAIVRSVPGGNDSSIANSATRLQGASAEPTGDRNARMAQAQQLLRQSPYWPRAQEISDAETGDNRVKMPVHRTGNVTMDQVTEILRQSPYYAEATHTGQVNKSQEDNNDGQATVEPSSRRHRGTEEAGNKLHFWDTYCTVSKEEQHAYLHGYRLDEKTPVIDYWVIKAHVTDAELVKFEASGVKPHNGQLTCRHRHGLSAVMRGSALVHFLPDQGHIVGETQFSRGTHFVRDSNTTFHAHRELLEQDQDRHMWVEGRIKQGQPDGHALTAAIRANTLSPPLLVAAGGDVPAKRADVPRENVKDNSADRSKERGNSADRSKERGNSADRSKERGNSADRSKERGNSANRMKERGNSADRSKERGNSADRSKERGNSADRPQEKGNSADRPQERGSTDYESHELQLKCWQDRGQELEMQVHTLTQALSNATHRESTDSCNCSTTRLEDISEYTEANGNQQIEHCGALTSYDWKETFEGKPNEDIDRFMKSFDIHCRLAQVEDAELCDMLWLHLKGHAQEMIMRMPDKTKDDYLAMRQSLLERFGKGDQREDAKAKIKDLSYVRGSRIMELIGELMMLLQKAYPTEGKQVQEARAYDIVMEKLPHDMQREMALLEVDTLEDVKRKAPTIEKLARIQASLESRIEQSQVPQMVATAYTPVNQTVEVLPPSYTQGRGLVQGNPIREIQPWNYNTGYEEEQQFNTNQQLMLPHNDYEDYEEQDENEEDPRVCDHCGRPGHVAFRCWSNPKGGNFRSNWGPNRQIPAAQVICWNCQQPGHFARDCTFAIQATQDYVEDLVNQLRDIRLAQQQQGPIVQHAQITQGNTNDTSLGSQRMGNTQTGARQQGPRHEYTNTVTLEKKRTIPTKSYSNEEILRLRSPKNNPADKQQARDRGETERVGTRAHALGAEQRQVIIPMSINGYAQAGLIDTGSSVTIASISLARALRIKLRDTSKLIKGVSGDTTVVTKLGRVRLWIAGHARDIDMCFRNKEFDRTCAYNMIIGVDVLQHFPPFSINIGQRLFKMGSNTTQWKTRFEMSRQQKATNKVPVARANRQIGEIGIKTKRETGSVWKESRSIDRWLGNR